MVVMPYYNKPSQDGLREHVLAVARAVACPIVLYNIPGRSVVDLAADTTERICERAPNVVGIKDATGNVLRCQELERRLGDRLTVLSRRRRAHPADDVGRRRRRDQRHLQRPPARGAAR